MLTAYATEFLTIAIAHALAVASPGPDYAIVMRYSLNHGRGAALAAAAGIGSGILGHTALAVAGISVLITTTPTAFTLLKFAAAAYLLWMAYQALRASAAPTTEDSLANQGPARLSKRRAFITGLITNGLNPKATLFFIALFAVVVEQQTPLWVKAGYGGYMAIATWAWFSLLACVLAHQPVRRRMLHYGHWLDRAMGVVLIGLAVTMVFTDVR